MEAGSFVLQTPLQSTGADMQRIGDILDVGTPAGEFLLYRYADTLDEVLVALLLFQLFLKLWRKHSQELGIAGDERPLGVGCTKHDGVAMCSRDHSAAEVALNGLYVRPGLRELHAKRREAGAGAVAGERERPSA